MLKKYFRALFEAESNENPLKIILSTSQLRKYPIIAATVENLLYKLICKHLFSAFYGSDAILGPGDNNKNKKTRFMALLENKTVDNFRS